MKEKTHSHPSLWPGSTRPSTSFFLNMQHDVDARHKAGHDDGEAEVVS
jgi:error-prone DNA polymerase